MIPGGGRSQDEEAGSGLGGGGAGSISGFARLTQMELRELAL